MLELGELEADEANEDEVDRERWLRRCWLPLRCCGRLFFGLRLFLGGTRRPPVELRLLLLFLVLVVMGLGAMKLSLEAAGLLVLDLGAACRMRPPNCCCCCCWSAFFRSTGCGQRMRLDLLPAALFEDNCKWSRSCLVTCCSSSSCFL